MSVGETRDVVLVVDDEPAIRLLCRVNLELAGYEVREAGTIDEARAELERGDVRVVLLDMHVGRERSEGLLDELREKQVSVAVVTGSTELAALAPRADAVLGKPFTIEELDATVRRLAGRDR